MTVNMPYQCFINGQFTDAEDGKTYDTINPTDGSVSNGSVGIVTTGYSNHWSWIFTLYTVVRQTVSRSYIILSLCL